MKLLKSICYLILLLVVSRLSAQNFVNEFEVQNQFNIKYNTTLINPSLNIFNPQKAEILINYRNQNSLLTDTPKTYLLSFTTNNFKNNGYGVSIFQNTVGVFKSFGAVANYAKAINLSEETILSLGFNIIAFNTDLNSNNIKLGADDPIFQNYDKTNSVVINPGVSLQVSNVNFGLTLPNLFDYNFRKKKQNTAFENKTLSGHFKFETTKNQSENLFENANLSLIGIGTYRKIEDFEYTGGLIYNAPKMGWIQSSYSNKYGISVGTGVTISQKISIGYTYEKNIINKLTDIGASHDIILTYNFGKNEDISYSVKKKSDNSTKTLEQEEIQRYKKKVYNKVILEQEIKTKQRLEAFVNEMEANNMNYLLLPEKSTGIKKGFYLVSKVLISSTIAENKTNEQKANGLRKSAFFTTASADWNYVYLERYVTLEEAKKAYLSNYNNKYNDPLWILPIL